MWCYKVLELDGIFMPRIMAASEAAAVEEKFRQMSLRSGEIEVINLTKKVSKDFISGMSIPVNNELVFKFKLLFRCSIIYKQ